MLHTKKTNSKRNNKNRSLNQEPVLLNAVNKIAVDETAKKLKISCSDVVNSLLDNLDSNSTKSKKSFSANRSKNKDLIVLSPENRIIVDDVAKQLHKDASFVINALLDKMDIEPILN